MIPEALTFDDVLLVPQRSSVVSRKDVETRTQLSRNITLNIPLVSANMDTVTESAMAIIMAREGGIGIIHRFLSIKDQVREVQLVKRADNIVIDTPFTIGPYMSLADAKEAMHQHNVSGLLVLDDEGALVGIITRRDIVFEEDNNKLIRDIMTPKERLVTAGRDISPEEARKILAKHRIEKLPLVYENKLCGLITAQDIVKRLEHPKASRDKRGRLLVGAAVGVKEDFIERAEMLVKAGCDVLVVDIAHGHSDLAINTVRELKKKFSIDIIAGNVATAEGTSDLIEAGADAVKVGVGGGSICITRIVTGSGVPQLQAILDCAPVAKRAGIPLIADGGIRNSGDMTKAIAAGASTVMLGNVLAGTDESPGITIIRNGIKQKVCRGMASFGAHLGRKEREGQKDDNPNDYVAEGVEAMVPYRGKVSEVIQQLVGGLWSGMSYCGARTVLEIQQNARFTKMTQSGLRESHPHDVNVVK